MKLRVGVVGLGQTWESRHAPALRALADRFEVRAFCDPVAHRAAEIARRWPARTCDGFRSLGFKRRHRCRAVALGSLVRRPADLRRMRRGQGDLLFGCARPGYARGRRSSATRAAGGRGVHGRVSLPAGPGHAAAEGIDGDAAWPAAAVVLQSPVYVARAKTADRFTRPTCGS